MLIISRKKDQKIVLADNIEITILEVGRNRVRFGVKAPKHIPIHTKLKGTEDETVGVAADGAHEESARARSRAFSPVD
jgi:carbon storage regulator CsrA